MHFYFNLIQVDDLMIFHDYEYHFEGNNLKKVFCPGKSLLLINVPK